MGNIFENLSRRGEETYFPGLREKLDQKWGMERGRGREGWMKKTRPSECKRVEMSPHPILCQPPAQSAGDGLGQCGATGKLVPSSPLLPQALQWRFSQGQGVRTDAVGLAGPRVPN